MTQQTLGALLALACGATALSIAGPTAAATKPMEYAKLGDSDLTCSKVCLGTMTWGEQNSLEEGVAQLDRAFDGYGINFLDTAEMYPVPTKAETQGQTDLTVGAWLRSRAGRRSEVVLATKVAGASERITWLRESGKGTRVSRADIIESVDASLRRLGTDYIDLLQIHWPDRYVPLFGADAYDPALERDDAVPLGEQLRALDELVRAGKVRHVGVSNETPFGVCSFAELAAREGLPKIVSIQNSYSLLVRADYENGLNECCSPRNHNVGLLAYSPLAGGILSGKYMGDEQGAPGSRFTLFPGFMERYQLSRAKMAVAAYAEVARKHGLSPAQLALAWCYSRPWVASTIIGATTLPQLEENIEAYQLEFTDEMNDDVNAVYKEFRDPSKTA